MVSSASGPNGCGALNRMMLTPGAKSKIQKLKILVWFVDSHQVHGNPYSGTWRVHLDCSQWKLELCVFCMMQTANSIGGFLHAGLKLIPLT